MEHDHYIVFVVFNPMLFVITRTTEKLTFYNPAGGAMVLLFLRKTFQRQAVRELVISVDDAS